MRGVGENGGDGRGKARRRSTEKEGGGDDGEGRAWERRDEGQVATAAKGNGRWARRGGEGRKDFFLYLGILFKQIKMRIFFKKNILKSSYL